MSIFKKKGTVESLFRMGEGAEGGKGPAAEPDGIKKHEVYYVRGRPFIAPAKAEKGAAPAPKQPKKNLFGGSPPIPKTPAKAQPHEKPKKDLTGAAVKKKTALALSAPQMAEEEWAALFRNNLLRSCWKPGLTSDEVQHVLTLWERKLVEVMHRWKHPDLWLAAGKWKRRTWRMDLISVMQKKCALQKQQAGLTKWRRWALCQGNPVLKGRGRRAIRRWHRVALMTGSISMCRLKSPFARMKAATRDGSLRRRRLPRWRPRSGT